MENSKIVDNGQISQDDEISLLDLFAVLLRYKKLIIGLTVFGMILGVALSVISLKLPSEKSFMPNYYTPKANMLITESASGASLPSGMSSLASLAGISMGGGGSSNSSLAQYLASSNMLYDALNERFDFVTRYEIEKSPVTNVRKALAKTLSNNFDTDSGVFSVSFTDIDPVFAQQVVNFSVDWLSEKFVELGVDKNTIQKTNLEKNIELSYKEILRLQQETQSLGQNINSGAGVWNIPNASIEITKLHMELEAQKTVYTSLKSQYELLKVQMQSEQPVFQVLEWAEVPDMKSKPSRGKLCIIITFAFGFMSVFIAFLLNALKNIKNDPEAMGKLKGIK